MPTVDDDIDALYRLSLPEFTSARNALVKRAGDRADEVRALSKPTAAAWAVNQLYWRQRSIFDALAKASDVKRTAVIRRLGGKHAENATADARHHAALERAFQATVAFLEEAGDAVTPETRNAVRQTLEAVPSPEVHGRLTRPLEAVGFSMLTNLMASQGTPFSARPPADVVMMKSRGRGHDVAPKTAAKGNAVEERRREEQARREKDERKRDYTRVVKELDAAVASERDANGAFSKARRALELADRRIESLEAQLKDARVTVDDRRENAERARLAVNDAAAARVTVERRLKQLED